MDDTNQPVIARDIGGRHGGRTGTRSSEQAEITHPETSWPQFGPALVKPFSGQDLGLHPEPAEGRIGESLADSYEKGRHQPRGTLRGEGGEAVTHRRVDLDRCPADRVHHEVLQRVQSAQSGQRLVTLTHSENQGDVGDALLTREVDHPGAVTSKLAPVPRRRRLVVPHTLILSSPPTGLTLPQNDPISSDDHSRRVA